ncbi:transcription factor RfeG [Hirsutella rhossiliensis]
MSRQTRTPGQAPPPPATRQNEYFVPRDGIDREVISADICRYLGNDALVRPGQYENPQSHLTVQGYYITAYRNLTTAMIEDLKADSARWESERRAQTTRNTSGVQYRYSETHQSRQHHGPTEGHFQSDPYARDPGYEVTYPGTGNLGFTGASGSYSSQQQQPPQQQQQQQQQQHQHQQPQQQQQQPPPPPPYAAATGGAYGGGFQQPQQSPPPERFTPAQAGGSMMRPGYPTTQDAPYIGTGANLPHSGFPSQNDPYGARLSTSSAAPQQPIYASASPQQPGYPATTSSFQQYPTQAPTAPGQSYSTMQPHDSYYGRGSSDGAPQATSLLCPLVPPCLATLRI